MSVGEGRQESLAPSAAPEGSAGDRDHAPRPHGVNSGRFGSPGRRTLTVLGAITACAGAALACSPGTGTATVAFVRARSVEVSTSVQSGPAGRISTVAVILPADAAPVSSSSTPASSAAPTSAAPSSTAPTSATPTSSAAPTDTPTPTASATPSGAPTATPTPTASATPTATPTPTPSPRPSRPRPTPTPRPSRTPSVTPSAEPSPTRSTAPPATAGSPDPTFAPVVQVQSATPALAALSRPQTRQTRRKSRPSPAPSATAPGSSTPGSSTSEPSGQGRRDVAGTLADTANTSPPIAAIAVIVAALGALAGCGFALARRRPRFALARRVRPVPSHSHRAPRQSRRRSIWR